MSDTGQGVDIRGCGGDVAAYALGALDPPEVESFRAHLETCAVCRDELAAFQHVVDVMAISAPQYRAPKRLRRRVLKTVAREPQLGGRRRRTPRLLAWLPRPALALGAAVALAAVAVGGIELGTTGMTQARVYRAQVTGTGSAEVAVSDGRAELIVHDFAPPPAGEIYEVWLGRPGHSPAPTSALFSVTATGDGDVEVPGSLRGVNLVTVTPEPAGGSRVPTHPAVIRARLS